MKEDKFLKWFTVAVLGATLTALPSLISGIETGTGTNQAANLYATNSITLRGSVITSWQGLTNSLDAFYIKNSSNWSYYVAVSNVNLSDKELTNVAAMTLGGERRTTWPSSGSGGEPSNWSYYAAVSDVNLNSYELTNVAAITLAGDRRTNWPISTLRTTSDQVVNSTAFVNITGLTFAVVADTDYAFDFYIIFRNYLLSTGFRFGVNGPYGKVDYFQTYQTIANSATVGVATWLQRHDTNFNSMTATTTTITSNVDLHCRITGRFLCTSNGTFAATVASEIADTNIVVRKGSWGTYF